MTRTLITGAAGFTGRYLAALLAEQGHQVHGLVHGGPDQSIDGVVEVHEADLADFNAVKKVVDDVRPRHVVHLAAIAFVGHDNIGDLYRSNVVGTRQLLEALSKQDEAPDSVIVASSANIYGNSQAGVLDEATPPSPANDYGVSKVTVEYLARLYSTQIPIVLVRPFNYTGVGQSPNFVVPKIVQHARERKSFIELGNLDVSRDFSDVRTVVDAYSRLLTEPKAHGGTFNICSGEAVSLKTIIELVENLSGHRFEIRTNPAFVRANEVHSLCGSRERVESVIGPLNHIPLAETLRWMVES